MYKISFVVDHSPLLYYQAELLLFSLGHFAKHKKEDILVQCTNRVDETFLAFLRANDYTFSIIEPFLDGKYCNKIQQLAAFDTDGNYDGVFLIDTDVFALEAFAPADPHKFCAKIVDGPNPPIRVLEKIYGAAKLARPKPIGTDWYPDEMTFDTNFNGGYYYIPKKQLSTLAKGWKKWATWLFERPTLFEQESQFIHVDQVAMGMAIVEAEIGYANIASNYNCPVHSPESQQYFDPEKPVSMLHYHGQISVFGTLDTAFASNNQISGAMEKANSAIAAHASFVFYGGYRRSLVEPPKFTEKSKYLHAELTALKAMHGNDLKLIIHGGLPKTGTTSLQSFFHQNNHELLKSGYIYPDAFLTTHEPKHQWLMRAFLTGNAALIVAYFKTIFSQLKNNTHTIILSTEGIHMHWVDFGQEARSFLQVLSQVFPTEFWVWFRQPTSFMNSLYRQYLKNPKTNVACYGQDMSLGEMMEDEWFMSHFDYLGFIYDLESIMEGKDIKVFKYHGDIIATVKHLLHLDEALGIAQMKNISLGDSTIELLRIINRFPLSQEEKEACVNLLGEIDKILVKYPQEKIEDLEPDSKMEELSSIQSYILSSEYQLSF